MERTPMILSAFFFNPQGDHRMSWRHPDAPGREIFDLSYYRRLAEAAESACMDAIFVADHVAIWDTRAPGWLNAPGSDYPNFNLRSRSALAITLTEDRDMAAAAIMGERRRPRAGYKTPAAMGTPAAL